METKRKHRNTYRKTRQVKFLDNKKRLRFERIVKEKRDELIEETVLGKDLIIDLKASAIVMFIHPSDLLKTIVKKGLKELKRNHYQL